MRIDFKSWWYKNCKTQRRKKAKICDECPFKKDIMKQEAMRAQFKMKGILYI